jgi:hypothetical protein
MLGDRRTCVPPYEYANKAKWVKTSYVDWYMQDIHAR